MEIVKKLRHDVLENKEKLNNEVIKNYLSEEEFNKLLKLLEDIESKLGVVQDKLHEGREDLTEGFEKSIKHGLSLLQSFFEDHTSEKAEEVRENIWKAFSPWLDGKVSPIRPSKVEQIIEAVLMDDPNDKRVFVIPIIGMSTATNVAQCVYHDSHVQQEFNIKHWVCMCDMVNEHPSKLLDILFRKQVHNKDVLEKFHDDVKEKRYLLVLDGVKAANLGSFLSDLLRDVKHGSKIILTASSCPTLGNLNPLVMPNGAPFEVADKDQQPPQAVWSMFTNTVKFKDEDKEKDKKLEIGKVICIKFATFPRLLQLIASYLDLRKSVQEWKDVQKDLLISFEEVLNDMSKFKHMCYKELQPMNQQYEWYCSLFPNDYPFQKTDLIHLWTSQKDLLTTEEKPQELVGEEHFVELCRNKFFLEHSSVRNDKTGALSYKMHDLVKRLLEDVTKHEFCLLNKKIEQSDICSANTRHLCFNVSDKPTFDASPWLQNPEMLQSLLFQPSKLHNSASVSDLNKILGLTTCLRALNLAAVELEKNPLSLGKLKELRYLKLGISSKCLSDSVTKLLNLQTLDLRASGVTILPKDFCTLKNLRHLYTGGKLIDLPPNFGKLNNLQTLDVFIVGKNNGLAVLSSMRNLVGKLTIRIEKYDCEIDSDTRNLSRSNDAKKNDTYARVLNGLNLTALSLVLSNKDWEKKSVNRYSSLEPPPGLESITISHWEVGSFPCNLINGRSAILKSLVSVHIEHCPTINDLTDLSKLPHLKSLQLWDLRELKCILGEGDEGTRSTSSLELEHYFPELEYVTLAHLPEFVGWKSRKTPLPIPSQGLKIRVSDCNKMQSMPAMASLVTLVVHKTNGSLLNNLLSTNIGRPSPSITLTKLEIDSIIKLGDTLSISKLIVLNSLTIRRCSEMEKVVLESLTSLQQLEIHDCRKLKDITCVPDQLCSLKTLEIKNCEKLALINNNFETSWKCFENLISLKLINVLSLKSLENGLCSLEKLKQLSIHSIYELRALPEWIGNLKQLEQLAIRNCHFLLTLPDSLGNLSALKKLELHCCPKLRNLPNCSFKSLEEISLYSINEVRSLLDRIAKLKQVRSLSIRNCPSLSELPESLGNLSSLQQLELHQCPNLTRIPNSITQLTSLQKLNIQ